MSKYVLWTIPDPEQALSEWLRVVKPGGKVIYIDGNWTTDLERSWFRRRWRDLVRVHRMIKAGERESQGHRGKVDHGELWSVHADRPRKDLEMMSGMGFAHIESRFIPYRSVLKGKRRFRYGFYNGNFLLLGVKKDKE